jgi:hypothetical protein
MLVNAGICKVPRCGSGGRGISHKSHDSLLGVDQIQPLAVVRVSCCSFFASCKVLNSVKSRQLQLRILRRTYKTLQDHMHPHIDAYHILRENPWPNLHGLPRQILEVQHGNHPVLSKSPLSKVRIPHKLALGMTVAICGHARAAQLPIFSSYAWQTVRVRGCKEM